jgi:hypothetical protein
MGVNSSVFQFSIYKRSDSKNWQVQFRDTSGHLIQRGTGTPNKLKAYQIAADWQANGLPTREPSILRPLVDAFTVENALEAARKSPLTPQEAVRIVDILRDRSLVHVTSVQKEPEGIDFMAFLEKFWDYDRSEYIQDKLAHGQRFGRARAYDMSCRLKLHWEPYFSGKKLSEITKLDLKAFSAEIAKKGLAPSTINHTIEVGTIALSWAHQNDLIATDPGEGLRSFSGASKKRGVLEPDEVARLFAEPWPDERSHVGNLVAATTGLRAGEILALRVDNIGRDRIHVRHS